MDTRLLGQFLKTRKNEYKTGRCPAKNKLCTLIEKSMILDKVYFMIKGVTFDFHITYNQ
jgi:hypothetical protein